jgi:histone H3/H4
MRHRDAWAVEKRAPSKLQWAEEQADEQARGQGERTRRRRLAPPANIRPQQTDGQSASNEILIVASKLKAYIKARSGMNTSASVLDDLSDRVRDLCNEAIRNAAMAERRTVLDRDIPQLVRRGSDSYGYD